MCIPSLAWLTIIDDDVEFVGCWVQFVNKRISTPLTYFKRLTSLEQLANNSGCMLFTKASVYLLF